MSQETSNWLNTQTLIGFTEKRGNAWHYRASEQGVEPNHYPLAVPVADVRRRLFHWKAEESPITFQVGGRQVVDPTRKGIVRPDTNTLLGVFRQGYKIHDYDEWLIRQASSIADSDLDIASAGLLKGGALAWVQFEFPETLQCEGVGFRPFFTSTTALDGSLATTYQTGSTFIVCDNTHAAAMMDKSHQHKVRHSSKSIGRLGEVRDTLGIVYATADAMEAEIREMVATTVTDRQWAKFLDSVAPAAKEGATPRAAGMAARKRDELDTLYHSDARAATWKGTALGVLQAANTWEQHFQNVRGMDRPQRNALNMVTGQHTKADVATVATLQRVLAN